MCKNGNRLDHLDIWICVYLCVCVCVFNILKVIVRDVVSCLVWFHSDSDLLGFCSISHSCNIMRCESQGQVLCICVCFLSFLGIFCVFVFVCVPVYIAFSLCLPIPSCFCVCARVFVCG